jgi:signal transduction histidine kinase
LVKKDQLIYKIQDIDIVDFCRSRIEFFTQNANLAKSNFIFNYDNPEIYINFIETKLQRIIDNNLTNAIKYTKENHDIYVALKKTVTKVILTISSHSSVIQYPDKIFEEYYREEKSQEGFGLGLNLVKRICDEEDVTIKLESNKNSTTFTYIFKGI